MNTLKGDFRFDSLRPKRSKRVEAVGMIAIATSIEAKIAPEMAIEISENNWPASSSISQMGAKTIMVVRVEARMEDQTSLTPLRAASTRPIPLRRSFSILSSTTIALSTVIPMAKATPAREMTLMVRSAASKLIKAEIVQTGIPSTQSRVPGMERRKSHNTRVAARAPTIKFLHTFWMDAST